MLKTEFESIDSSVIERATLSDLIQIISINHQLYEGDPDYGFMDRWSTNGRTSREVESGNFFVFRSGADIKAAICLIAEVNASLQIDTLAVRKSEHHKGIGRKMIDFATNYAIANGFRQIKVGSLCYLNARDFYLKCGFEFDNPATKGAYDKEYYRFIKRL